MRTWKAQFWFDSNALENELVRHHPGDALPSEDCATIRCSCGEVFTEPTEEAALRAFAGHFAEKLRGV